jgi:hypothetical protein
MAGATLDNPDRWPLAPEITASLPLRRGHAETLAAADGALAWDDR